MMTWKKKYKELEKENEEYLKIKNKDWDTKLKQEIKEKECWYREFWELRKKHRELEKGFDILKHQYEIKKIVCNKKATIVWFDDNTKIVVKLAKGDKGSVYTAVAYAIAKKMFETNTAFKRYVERRLEK